MSEENAVAIKQAKKVLKEISEDEHERYLAFLRQKYIMDQKATEQAGYYKGLEARKRATEYNNGIQQRYTTTVYNNGMQQRNTKCSKTIIKSRNRY